MLPKRYEDLWLQVERMVVVGGVDLQITPDEGLVERIILFKPYLGIFAAFAAFY